MIAHRVIYSKRITADFLEQVPSSTASPNTRKREMEWVKENVTLEHEHEEYIFMLVDQTGKVLVDPKGAKQSLVSYKRYNLSKDEIQL